MMDFIKQNKLLSGGALLALAIVFYYFVFAGSGTTDPSVVTETTATSPASQQLLVTLSNLRSIDLNAAIFSDPVFVSLSDFGVVIPQEPVGRRNPFMLFNTPTQSTSTLKLPTTL